MDAEAVAALLAPLNASLNGTSALFLMAGFLFIKRGERDKHRFCMLGAVGASALFLVFYLIRYSLTGTHRFPGTGIARVTYLTILFSHMTLAVVTVPLVIRLLFLAAKKDFRKHARLARWTFPIWLYVSLTGLAVYFMLYRMEWS